MKRVDLLLVSVYSPEISEVQRFLQLALAAFHLDNAHGNTVDFLNTETADGTL